MVNPMKSSSPFYRDKFLLFLLIVIPLTLIGIFPSSNTERGSDPMPVAKKGFLDLTRWDFAQKGLVKLDGEWEFYPNELLGPDAFRSGRTASRYMDVPAPWDQDPAIMGKWGYATYRLAIQIAPSAELLGIAKKSVRMADQLYVNGRAFKPSGQVGVDRQSYTPGNIPGEAYFYVQGNQLEVILQVANYDYFTGGIGMPLSFGHSEDILFLKNVNTSLEMSASIILLLFGVFYLSLFFWFRNDSSLFFFGAYFLLASGMMFLGGTQRLFMQYFPELPFELSWSAKDFLSFATIPLLSLFTVKVYPAWKYKHVLLAPGIIFGFFCLAIILLPYRYYIQAMPIFHSASIVYYLWLLIVFLVLYARGNYGRFDKKEMRYFILSIYLLIFFLFQYFLVYASKSSSTLVGNLALLLFVVSITMMLANRYHDTFSSMLLLTRKLQAADQAKDEFLIRTSHELKTPLHGIINISQNLMERSGKQSVDETRDRLELIHHTAYRMSNMVNDLIDLAKIRDGTLDMQLKVVNVAACTAILFEVFSFLTKGKNIQLNSVISPNARYVIADENRLMQVLSNLVDNSLKYTDQGSITISTVLMGDVVTISVEDTGRGIPPQNKNSIFHPYQRGEGASELDNRGIGLGLSIVQKLVRLMGGTVALDWSKVNEGSRFSVSLPSATAPTADLPANAWEEVSLGMHESAASLAAASPSFSKEDKTILVVDDEVLNVEVLRHVLTLEGWQVVTALSGEEALKKISSALRLDLVLLDVMLPGLSGYDVCRAIRETHSLIELPVLFVSVRNSPADKEAGLSAGGNDFLSKPFDAKEVCARVRTLLTMKQLARESTLHEMAFLHSQIKPHFLYNALGTIMSLCYTDGAKAGELLGSFSKYLRIIFQMDNPVEIVELERELELVNAYVTIEQARFGKRLHVFVDADEQLLQRKVLPLTIQPLVENAIRHGVLQRIEGGSVFLSIREQDGGIQVIVRDDGVGMSEEQIQELLSRENTKDGVGVANINKRLYRWTGKRLSFESALGEGTTVVMWIPFLTGEYKLGQ